MDKRLAGLMKAAEEGNPEAITHLAHVQALGIYTPRDLDAALANLERAASLGWPNAQRELQLLARNGGEDWRALHASIDLDALRKPTDRRVLLERPRVRVFEAFAKQSECDWLVALARGGLSPARVYHDQGATSEVHAGRTNSEAAYDLHASDVVLSVINDRVARATGIPIENFEIGQLLNYQPGQTFARHSDFLQPGMREEIEARGQRVATFLIYLNEDYDAGETEFTEVNFKFKAHKGDALMFLNVDAEGAPDPMSLHAGLPPTRGEKWVLSLWLRGKPVNAYKTPGITGAPLPPEWYRDA